MRDPSTETAPITMDALRKAKFEFFMHLNLGNVHVSTWQCVEYPELGVVSRVLRGRRGKSPPPGIRPGRFFTVAGVDEDFEKAEDALEHLNAIYAAKAKEAAHG